MEKVTLVTGATSGIGRAVARELARAGGTVVLVGRDRAKLDAAAAEARAANGAAKVETLQADLSVQAEVRRLAQDFLRSHDRLHVLVNCAGVHELARKTTADGIETNFATNHLAYFLLTNLLRDVLMKSAP